MFFLDFTKEDIPDVSTHGLNQSLPIEAPARLQNHWTGCAHRELRSPTLGDAGRATS